VSAAPKGVVWDVGNVIVRWDPRTLYSKLFPDPAERDDFLSRVCTLAWHVETDRGLPPAENTRRLIDRFPEHEPHIRAWWDRWDEMFSGVIEETVEVIEALAARGIPQFGLTNMAAHCWPSIRAMTPAFEHLSYVLVSGEHGLVKPDPAIYRLLCEKVGMEPEELLFVDDSAANVEAARELGFEICHFANPTSAYALSRLVGS
jgi:2-haloacid dehalogenase